MAQEPKQGSALFDMLAELARNPTKLDDFKADPERVMREEYYLDDEQISLLMSGLEGNAHDFLKAIGDEIEVFGEAPNQFKKGVIEKCWC